METDYLDALQRGDVTAPAMDLLGIRLVSADRGVVAFEMDPDESHLNPMSTVHGGIITTLADTAMGVAVLSTLQPGERFTTIELKTSFVGAARVDTGTLSCEARVLHAGKRTAFVEATVIGPDGALIAQSSSTCAVFR